MRAALSFAALIAGCGSEGIFLEVRPPQGSTASTVELFLGLEGCAINGKPCERMQPAEFARPEQASVYFRQPEDLVATVQGGAARFRFSSEDQTVPVVIAVAFAGETAVAAGTIEDFDLRTDPLHVILELAPAAKLTPDSSGGGDTAPVTVWSRDRSAICVGAELASGEHAYVVPERDPDCDAVNAECDPLGYLATRPGDQPCVATQAAASGPACMLGGAACREDPTAQSPACVTDFIPDCVPGAVCSCDPTDLTCLKDKLATGGVARMACRFSSEPDPNNAMRRIPCAGDVGAAPAKLDTTTLPFALRCTQSPTIGAVALPLELGGELALAGQMIKIKDFTPAPCDASVQWSGEVGPQTPARQDGLIGLEVEAGAVLKRRHVILPLEVSFDGQCTEAQTCSLVAGSETDTVWACAD